MPIVVQQPGIAGQAAGQLLAQGLQAEASRKQADIQQLRQIEANRDTQLTQIQANAEQQQAAAESAMQQTAMQAGLGQQMADDAFERELFMQREKAQQEASQWETKFTAQQRQDIQKMNNAIQAVDQDPNFSEDERSSAITRIKMAQAGITPSMMPKDPSKKQYAKGQGPGDIYVDEATGHTMAINIDGRPAVLAKYSDSREAVDAKLELDMSTKRLEGRRKLRADLIKDWNSRQLPGVEKPVDPAWLEDNLRLIDPDYARDQDDFVQQQALQQQQDDQRQQEAARQELEENWPEQARAAGMNVQPEDLDVPAEVGYAQAYVRTTLMRGGRPEDQSLYRNALKVIEDYARSQGFVVPNVDFVPPPEAQAASQDLLDQALEMGGAPETLFGRMSEVMSQQRGGI